MAAFFNGKHFLDELQKKPDERNELKDERKKEFPFSRKYVGKGKLVKGKEITKGKRKGDCLSFLFCKGFPQKAKPAKGIPSKGISLSACFEAFSLSGFAFKGSAFKG